MKSIGDYFAAFDERAGEPARRREDDDQSDGDQYGGASSGFCLGALVIALGSVISTAASMGASPV